MSDWLRLHYNEFVVLAGTSLLGLTAGVVGCYAVLRRRSLLGDALGHATLPGLCIGFLLAGQRSMPLLLAGALGSSLLALAVYAGVLRWTRLREDAGIGLILSVFYAAGVVGLSLLAKLERSGQAGLESFLFGKTAGMILEDVYWAGGLAVVTLAILVAFGKELKLVTFDPAFARVQGWPVTKIDFLLLLLLALAVVLGLPAVGALLVAALLIIPAAAARFWTLRLPRMLLVAGLFGLASGAAGTWVSSRLERLPPGPAIILIAATIFLVSLLVGPARGLVARRGLLAPEAAAELVELEGSEATP